ncbi:MAG: response regulator [Thermodesulfovibrionales bacterium]|nr:response regulator [Thermodesulfovibrionales bacterium]
MSKKILIVDDSISIRLFLKSFVLEKGYSFIEAKDGQEGLEKFMEYDPDITILDLTMPVMTGMEALEKMKEHNPEAKIWIMTADTQKKTHEHAISLGAESVLKKPPVKEVIHCVIDQ